MKDLSCIFDDSSMTEFEFFQAGNTRDPDSCFGKALAILYTEDGYKAVHECLDMSAQHVYRDRFLSNILGIVPTESNPALFQMCLAHWMDIALVVVIYGVAMKNDQWRIIGENTFYRICSLAGFDYKEMLNYLRWRSTEVTDG